MGVACREIPELSGKVDRMVKIWDDRKVFPAPYLVKLRSQIAAEKKGAATSTSFWPISRALPAL